MSLLPFFARSYWDPFRSGYFPRCLFDQDFGLPPYPEQPLRDWIGWVEDQLNANWSRRSCPVLAENTATSHGSSTLSQRPAWGMPMQNLDNWKICLDVKHFTPEELQVKRQEDYLEISGNHVEKEDQHGFISRTFTRKYKLPSGVNARSVTSTLTSNSILIVEAPLSRPTEVRIPVQIEKRPEDVKKVEKEEEKEVLKKHSEEEEMSQAREAEEEKGISKEPGKEMKEELDKGKEEEQGKEVEGEKAQQEEVLLEEQEKK
ncbi:heat shock protein beta-1-like [Mobula birostris]|uniref:heat shock protein beta-1-like n=1 Tax=Mobula birostris TaxID=1983395 RepID=UPI003B27B814